MEEITKSHEKRPERIMGFVLKLCAWISLLGGVITFFAFLPGEAEPGYSWKIGAYIPALAFLSAGMFQALILGALGTIIDYLASIADR